MFTYKAVVTGAIAQYWGEFSVSYCIFAAFEKDRYALRHNKCERRAWSAKMTRADLETLLHVDLCSFATAK